MQETSAELLSRLRNDRHLTQEELADASNVSRGTVAHLEQDASRFPQSQTLRNLLRALNTKVALSEEERMDITTVFKIDRRTLDAIAPTAEATIARAQRETQLPATLGECLDYLSRNVDRDKALAILQTMIAAMEVDKFRFPSRNTDASSPVSGPAWSPNRPPPRPKARSKRAS